LAKHFQRGEIEHLEGGNYPDLQSTADQTQLSYTPMIPKQLQYEPRIVTQSQHYQQQVQNVCQARHRITPLNQRSGGFQYLPPQRNRSQEIVDMQRKQMYFGDTASQGTRKALNFNLYSQPMQNNQILQYHNTQQEPRSMPRKRTNKTTIGNPTIYRDPHYDSYHLRGEQSRCIKVEEQ